MHRSSLSLVLFLLGPATALPQQRASAVPECKPVTFEGVVHRGESFRHPLSGKLQFVLDPSPGGWVVRVWPQTGPHQGPDLAELATPPFRSINPLLLTTSFGLRAQDVIGWNPRTFFFLPSTATAPAAERAYRAVLATPHPTSAEQAAVTRAIATRVEAQLQILDAEILPGSANQTPAAAAVAQHLGQMPFRSLAGTRPATPAGELQILRFRVTLPDLDHRRAAATCHETPR